MAKRRQMGKSRRKLILRRVARELLEELPDTLRVTERTLSKLTIRAWQWWETTAWAREYPNTIPVVTTDDDGRMVVAFGERPEEESLDDLVDLTEME